MFSPLNSGINILLNSKENDKKLGKKCCHNVNSILISGQTTFWRTNIILFLPAKSLSLAPSPKSCLLTPLNIPKCLEPPFCVEFPTWRSRSAITQYSERRAATIITNAIKANTAVTIPVPRRLKRLAILLHGIIRTCFGESFAK